MIRPDSGDPAAIGRPGTPLRRSDLGSNRSREHRSHGDEFGATVNDVGVIYGDSITHDRADEICARLVSAGFATTNVVLGVGSFTYQYTTRLARHDEGDLGPCRQGPGPLQGPGHRRRREAIGEGSPRWSSPTARPWSSSSRLRPNRRPRRCSGWSGVTVRSCARSRSPMFATPCSTPFVTQPTHPTGPLLSPMLALVPSPDGQVRLLLSRRMFEPNRGDLAPSPAC